MRSTADAALRLWMLASTRCPCFGGRKCQADGLGVAHLADEQHVRILPQGIAKARRKVPHVASHLPLPRRAAHLVPAEHILDGVLERNEHPGAPPKHLLGEGGEGRALARTRGAAHEDEAMGQVDDVIEGHRQPEVGEGGRRRSQEPNRRRAPGGCLVQVDAEASDAVEAQRQIQGAPRREAPAGLLGQGLAEQLGKIRDGLAREPTELAAHPARGASPSMR